jgi:hypothetical protein
MDNEIFTLIRGMVRKGDPFTCILAATTIEKKASELHAAITLEIRRRGPMTDGELEDLSRFSRYAYSSVRKRRTELFQGGLLISVGSRKNKRGNTMLVWDLIGRVEPEDPRQGDLF